MDTSVEKLEQAPSAGGGSQPKIERIARVDHARPGDYWRTTKKIRLEPSPNAEWGWDKPYTVEKGTVLLVADVRKSGDQDHTVVLQRHPLHSTSDPGKDTSVWILLGDFYNAFQHAPDAEQVRQEELGELQVKMNTVQAALTRASTDPAYLNSMSQEALEEGGDDEDEDKPKAGTTIALPGDVSPVDVLNAQAPSLTQAMSAGNVALAGQAIETLNAAKSAVQRQANWFVARVKEIQGISADMLPFALERTAVAMARNRGAVAQAKRLMEGVSTLSLFTGEKVTCTLIVDGLPALAGTPIKLFQKKLWLDEEVSYITDYLGQLYCTDFGKFVDALKESQALRDLLIPAQRGVVLAGVSRQRVHFGDSAAAVLQAISVENGNKATFLMVRDGERWFTIDSPIESHEACSMLFPEKDVDGTVFGGIDGDRVTITDLRWTKALDHMHSLAVHYRRFAVTLAGLIAKEQFWEGVDPMQLFTGAGNESIFQLVADASGEGSLDDGRESLAGFLERNRETVRAGSRVLVNLDAMVDESTTEGAFHNVKYYDGYRMTQVWKPEQKLIEEVVRADGADLYVTAWFTGGVKGAHSGSRKRIRVTLNSRGHWYHHTAMLAIDRLDPEELERHMAKRANRGGFMSYMAVFRRGKELAIEWQKSFAPQVQQLAAELVTGRVCKPEEAESIALRALGGWESKDPDIRSAKNPDMEAVRLLAYRLANAGQIDVAAVESLARDAGMQPLRLVVDGDGRVVLYTTDPAADNRVLPQAEVLRHIVEFGARKGFRLTTQIHELLWKKDIAVLTLRQWPEADDLVVEKEPVITLRRKQAILADIDARFTAERDQIFGPWTDEQQVQYVRNYWQACREWPKRIGKVTMPAFSMPFGMAVCNGKPFVLAFRAAGEALAFNLNEERRHEMAKKFSGQFNVKGNRYEEVYEAKNPLASLYLVAWPAEKYACDRTMWDDYRARWVWLNPSTKVGKKKIETRFGKRETYTSWNTVDLGTGNRPSEELSNWLRLAQLPQEFLYASDRSDKISGLVLAAPIASSIDEGGSFVQALAKSSAEQVAEWTTREKKEVRIETTDIPDPED